MNRIGCVARMDDSGLGNQTRALCQLLKPERILVVDSTGFRKNSKQNPDWYDGFNAFVVSGFLTNRDCLQLLKGNLTHIFFAETAYNDAFYSLARTRGVKTLTQINPEFFENWQRPHLPLPSVVLLPSRWFEEEIRELLPKGHPIVYLPPPIFPSTFSGSRKINITRTGKRRFVHIIGKPASKDRAGTLTLLEALNYSKADYELVIRCQDEHDQINYTNDSRLVWNISNVTQEDIYTDFDACIQPRRYGGLNLVMNEALMSALPVIMTDISPNNNVLPKEWLIKSSIIDSLQTRRKIDVYNADPRLLAAKLDELAELSDKDLTNMKTTAFDIALNEYSPSVLKERYEEVMML